VLKKKLCCIANGKKVITIRKLPRDVEWFWDVIVASGLEPLTRTNYSILDHGVLTAFAERWHPETCTFHLPVGEVGITLDDVQCLLHISIEGMFLNHRKMKRQEGADIVSSFLGLKKEDVLALFAETNGPHLKHAFLQSVYVDNWDFADAALAEKKPMHEIRLHRRRL
ncbi:putative IMP dehydrogenase/GMP reductase, partial [Trifolium medium]|nr:putative IMP dehydrogenase/GMP reductase [Trifolium medium]